MNFRHYAKRKKEVLFRADFVWKYLLLPIIVLFCWYFDGCKNYLNEREKDKYSTFLYSRQSLVPAVHDMVHVQYLLGLLALEF